MPLELVAVPCRQDNYAFLLHDDASGATLLVDAPETAPIRAALTSRGWTLTDLLITHHHHDHVEGVADLREGARVIGAAADAHRLPPLDLAVAEGDTFTTCGAEAHVFDVSGHTEGHIAVHVPAATAVFTADSLMALGCGRLFEGTAPQMWASLLKLRALPDDTLVCSGHEYTETNYRFALTIDPDNPALQARGKAIAATRAKGEPTVPSTLAEEKATNPFLRADDPGLKTTLGMETAPDADVFAEIRARRDVFR